MRQRAENDSYFRELRKAAIAQRWSVDRTSNNHWVFLPPDKGRPVYFSGSPSDWRSMANFVAALRRQGLVPPSKVTKKKKLREAVGAN